MRGLTRYLAPVAVCAFALAATPAAAELKYGPWTQTEKCYDASPPVGPGRQGVKLPRAVGGKGARECVWVRTVLECPKMRDKILHPGKCTGKVREQRKRSISRPLD